MMNAAKKATSILMVLALMLSLVPVLGGAALAEDSHDHDDILFTAWTATDCLPEEAGDYYLSADVTVSAAWTVPDGTTNLCLDGHSITYAGDSGGVIVVEEGATLNLYDAAAGGGTITGGKGKEYEFSTSRTYTCGGSVCIENGTFVMNGGTISGCTAEFGGGVCVRGGTFAMNGGTITGCTAKCGGGVYLETGTLTMNGGAVSDCTADGGDGGGVYVEDGTFTMSGDAAISGNSTADYGDGGGVYVENGTVAMSGGTVSGNVSDFDGGGVYVDDGTFTMSGGSIENNVSDFDGGGVYLWESTFTMSGGAVSGNEAPYDGGGVCVGGDSIFTMDGGEITGNTAGSHGGGAALWGAFTMNGGTISGNTAAEDGGGVALWNGAFTMNGGAVSGNTAGIHGGGVYLFDAFSVSGAAQVTGNKTDSGADSNVYLDCYIVQDVLVMETQITVTGALTEDAAFGVTMAKPGVFTVGLSGRGSAANFTVDNTRDYRLETEDGEAKLVNVHSFTYSADYENHPETVIATCTDADCPLPDGKVTLTLVAPEDTVYSEYYLPRPTLRGLEEFNAATGLNIAEYDIQDIYFPTVRPEGIGTHFALLAVGTEENAAAAFVTYEIAKGRTAVLPTFIMYDSGSIDFKAEPDQEYTLSLYGEAADWTNTVELTQDGESEDVYFSADWLDAATQYTVHTRIKATEDLPAGDETTYDFVTCLEALQIDGSPIVGATLTAVYEPEAADGLTFQWYHGAETDSGEGYTFIQFEEAECGTGPSYTLTEADLGKYLKVIAVKYDTGIGDADTSDVVSYGTVYFSLNDAGDTVTEQGGLAFGDRVAKPANPSRTGYRFGGWYDSEDAAWDFSADTVSQVETWLYAKWDAAASDDDTAPDAPIAPAPQTVTVPVSGEDESVNVTVEITGDTAAIREADIGKVLSAEEVGAVSVDVSALEENISAVVIPGAMLTKIADAVADEDSTADGLEVKLPGGTVSFDTEAVAAIAEQAEGRDLTLHLDDVEVTELSDAQQEAVSDLAIEVVLDVFLTAGGERISDFKGGAAAVKVPYTLKDGQTARGLVVWHVADDGVKTQVPATYDGENIAFTVPHFSNYVIAYDAEKAAECPKDETCPLAAFTDLDPTAWYHDGIHFCLENELMNGVGHGKFNPTGAASRAMIVTILYRLEGAPEVTGENPFTDVADGMWYTDAVLWAAENGIVEGNGKGLFRPNDAVTREQLAAIFYRCAVSRGQGFQGMWMFLLDYPDAAEVSGWADEAMHWCVMNGIIQGKDGKLVPQGEATRAEAATMLMRFCTKSAE